MKTRYFLTFVMSMTIANIVFSTGINIGPGQTYPNIVGAAAVALPGDTIYLHAGLYSGYQYTAGLSGSKNNWIIITRYKNDIIGISGMWQFSSMAYVKLEKLNFSATVSEPGRLLNIDYGAGCPTISHSIIIDSCSFLNTGDAWPSSAGKFGGVDTFQIKNCIIKNCAGEGWGFNVAMNGTISGCRFENVAGGGFHLKLGSKNVTIQHNILKNCGGYALEVGGSSGNYFCANATSEAENIKVYSNIFTGCNKGISFNSCVNCEFINNTVYQCSSWSFRFTIDSPLFPIMSGNTIKNNIFAFNGWAGFVGYLPGPSAMTTNTAVFSKNIYYHTTNPSFTWADIYFDDPYWNNIKETSPLVYNSTSVFFVNPSLDDFHLDPSSPAIGAGASSTSPTADYYNFLYKTNRSIGAAEYGSVAAGIKNVIDEAYINVYPNPSNGLFTINWNKDNTIDQIAIYNALGQLILSQRVIGQAAEIDLTQYTKGIYKIIFMNNAGGRFSKNISVN